MKKVLVLALLLVVIASTVAAISAESASNEITLSGIKFKIPDGYNAIENEIETNATNDIHDIENIAVDKQLTAEYKNSAGDALEFEIGEKINHTINDINPANWGKKTINGKDGFLIKDTDDGKDKYKFMYLQDGKLVKISAVSEDIISQVIV